MTLDQGVTWVVLPTVNEVASIVHMIERVSQALAEEPHELCIVDDDSTDGTVENVMAYRDAHPEARIRLIQRRKEHWGSQRGAAVLSGLKAGLEGPADVFVEMDADLSHLPEELKVGLNLVRSGRTDVAIASKYLPGSSVLRRPWSRRLISRVANLWVRTFLRWRVSDYSNGYRFYSRAAARKLCGEPIRFGSPIYLSEGLARLMSAGMRVAEFPSTYVGRDEGLSKLRPIDLVKAAIAIFPIALRFHLLRKRRENLPR